MILAFAGRRIDPLDAPAPRFPLDNVPRVRSRVGKLLEESTATVVVSSAACGADLIALSEAKARGVPCRIVLPCSRDQFRRTSVVDRPGDWGPLFDRMLDAAESVVELGAQPSESAYLQANLTICDTVASLTEQYHQMAQAVLVWDGIPVDEHDVTEEFGVEARRRGFGVIEILTV
jgi:hypothetical protein